MATKSGSDVAVCRLVLQAVSETLRTNKRLLEKSARFTGAITTEPSCDAVTCFLVLYYTFLLFKIPDIFFLLQCYLSFTTLFIRVDLSSVVITVSLDIFLDS